MEWTGFLFLMLALKIPLGMLLYLVWWAVRQTPEEDGEPNNDGSGGSRVHDRPRRSPPRRPRRGPHGDPAPATPPRIRTTVARARTPGR
ncbi:MAG TPA: hypothetical protein VFF79_14195 [Conexibacter sp.]|jgi:hypothetical protein|nr:hypothetical protein [Conexibacter sp.]